MAVCSYLATCSFYNNPLVCKTEAGELLRQNYCEKGNVENCARLLVASNLGLEYLDDNLFPNMMDKARNLLKQRGIEKPAEALPVEGVDFVVEIDESCAE